MWVDIFLYIDLFGWVLVSTEEPISFGTDVLRLNYRYQYNSIPDEKIISIVEYVWRVGKKIHFMLPGSKGSVYGIKVYATL